MKKLLCAGVVLLLAASLFAAPGGKAETKGAEAGTSSAGKQSAGLPSRELVNAYFKRMFGYDPEIEVKVIRIVPSPIAGLSEVNVIFSTPAGQRVGTWYVSRDLKHAIVGEVLPFGADPFAGNRATLEKKAFGPAAGPADAKMLIVEFADLECPACRRAQPVMEKLRADFPQARFVFQSFPLPQHPWATRAAAYLDCIARQNQKEAFAFVHSIYSNQRDIEGAVRKTDSSGKVEIDAAAVTAQLRHYTQVAGADPGKIESCASSSETEGRIIRSVELGRSLGVSSTPTLFLNGRKIAGVSPQDYDTLKELASYESQQSAEGK